MNFEIQDHLSDRMGVSIYPSKRAPIDTTFLTEKMSIAQPASNVAKLLLLAVRRRRVVRLWVANHSDIRSETYILANTINYPVVVSIKDDGKHSLT